MSEISRPYRTTQGGVAPPNADIALSLTAKGWAVLPLCWPTPGGACGCGRRHTGRGIGKAPLTAAGVLDASSDEDQITGWWLRWPKANVGVDLAKSGLLFVGPDCPEAQAEAECLGLPMTTRRFSANGAYLYRRSAACPAFRIAKTGYRDILSAGYAVVYGTHQTGVPVYLDPPDGGDPASAPQWALDLLVQAAARGQESSKLAQDILNRAAGIVAGGDPPVALGPGRLAWWSGERFVAVQDGEIDRSATLFNIGLVLAGAGASAEQIVASLAERDVSLGFAKYSPRRDGGWRAYTGIAAKAILSARADVSNGHQAAPDSEECRLADDLLVDEVPPADASQDDPEAAGDGEGTPSGDGMSAVPSQHHRTPSCWRCKAQDLDNRADPICLKCRWVRCPHCGACAPGCTEGADDIALIKRRHIERAEAAVPIVGMVMGTSRRRVDLAERTYTLSYAPDMVLASWNWAGCRGWLRRQRLAALDALTEQAAGAAQVLTEFRIPLDVKPNVGKPTSRGRGRLNTLRRRIERLGVDAVIIRARGEAHVLVSAPELMAGGEAVPSDEVYSWLVDRIKDAMPPRYMSPARVGEKAITGVGAWKLTVLQEGKARKEEGEEEKAPTEQPGAPADGGGRPGTVHAEVVGEDAHGGVFLPDISQEEVEELVADVEESLPCFNLISSRPVGLYLDAEGGLKLRSARWVWKDTVAATDQEFLAHVRQLDRHFGMVRAGAWGNGRTRRAA